MHARLFVASLCLTQSRVRKPRLRTATYFLILLCLTLTLGDLTAGLPTATAARADVITVTTTADNTAPCTPANCSLRAAITLANSTADADTIILPAGIYRLTLTGAEEDDNETGDLDILGPVTITGAGAQETIIDGNGLDRVLHLRNPFGDPYQVFLEKLTVRNGKIDDSGGGIFVGSGVNLRLEYAVIRGNQSTGGDGGGGLYLQGSTVTVIRNSTLTDNEAAFQGGGLKGNSTLAMENSTISSNRAFSAAGLFSNDDTQLRNVTVSANTGGGVIAAVGTTFLIQNSIIAGNTGDDDCRGPIDSNGYNLVSSTCPLQSETNDLTEDDPGLAPLALNDGETPTHALLPTSPAIDAGFPGAPGKTGNACFVIDQRGVERPVDGNGDGSARCDIGAFEFVPADDPTPADLTLYLPYVVR